MLMLVLALPQAYDAHMNLILSEVEETISIVDVNEEGVAEGIRVSFHCLRSDHLLISSSTSDRNKADGDAVRSRRCSDHGETSGLFVHNVILTPRACWPDCASCPIIHEYSSHSRGD